MNDIVNLLSELSEETEIIKSLQKKIDMLEKEHKNTKSVLEDFINILNRLQANPTDEQTLNVARDMIQNMGVELMTERFIVDDCGTLIDMETRNTYDYVSELVPLLNELYNENKQLKRNVRK